MTAEAGGFEPPVPLGTPAFKAGAFGRSATLPEHEGNETVDSGGIRAQESSVRSLVVMRLKTSARTRCSSGSI